MKKNLENSMKHFLKTHGKKRRIFFLLGLSMVTLSFYAYGLQIQKTFEGSQDPNRVSIMSFNVENLFDTEQDKGKEDFTYLPLSHKKESKEIQKFCSRQKGTSRRQECLTLDWSEEVLKTKLKNLTEVVLQIYNQGPDILLLQEVENLKVLKYWNDSYLQSAGYRTIELVEGSDPRGIDVALMSRFPLSGPVVLHPLKGFFEKKESVDSQESSFHREPQNLKNKKKKRQPQEEFSEKGRSLKKERNLTGRGVLEVPLLLPNKRVLHVFVVHLPSQAKPFIFREKSVEVLEQLVAQVPPGRPWVIGGDWNISSKEEDKTGLISKRLNSLGLVSHLVGCQDCKGTYNHQKHWSFFDIFIFSRNQELEEVMDSSMERAIGSEKSVWRLIPESITIANKASQQTQVTGRPKRFDPKTGEGVSDHFPIYAEVEIISKTISPQPQ
jgi:exonuclease III